MTKKPTVVHTPWGPSQSQHEHAPGIVFYSTVSHGGYHLSDERYAEFCEIGHFAHWTQWLEEDCEAGLVYLRWPELATNEQIHDAVVMVRAVASWASGRWSTLVEGWLDNIESTPEPNQQCKILIRAQQHANDVRHLWQRGSMSTGGNGWIVSFRRGDERYEVVMNDYPTKRYYTDAELQAFPVPVPAPVKKRSPFPSHCFAGNGYDFEPSDADPGL